MVIADKVSVCLRAGIFYNVSVVCSSRKISIEYCSDSKDSKFESVVNSDSNSRSNRFESIAGSSSNNRGNQFYTTTNSIYVWL